jgi:hypothetical protein
MVMEKDRYVLFFEIVHEELDLVIVLVALTRLIPMIIADGCFTSHGVTD